MAGNRESLNQSSEINSHVLSVNQTSNPDIIKKILGRANIKQRSYRRNVDILNANSHNTSVLDRSLLNSSIPKI